MTPAARLRQEDGKVKSRLGTCDSESRCLELRRPRLHLETQGRAPGSVRDLGPQGHRDHRSHQCPERRTPLPSVQADMSPVLHFPSMLVATRPVQSSVASPNMSGGTCLDGPPFPPGSFTGSCRGHRLLSGVCRGLVLPSCPLPPPRGESSPFTSALSQPAALVQCTTCSTIQGTCAEAVFSLACCRPTPACSVWSSTPTSSCPSTQRPSWRCTGVRSGTRCHPMCTQ